MKLQEDIVKNLINSNYFSKCSKIDLSRIAPQIKEERIQKDGVIFRAKEDADKFYLIVDGEVELKSGKRSLHTLKKGFLGEESITPRGEYLTTAVAASDTILLIIPQKQILQLIKIYPDLKDDIYSSLLNHTSHFQLENNSVKKQLKTNFGDDATWVKIIGWILTIVVPVLILTFGDSFSLNWKEKIFITVASATVLMWIFRLAHEFIPSILSVLVILILDVAPPSVALSGFTSGSFFMAMSIFGISALLISSGLTHRMVIVLFRRLPLSQFWHSFAIFITGIFLTPLLPSANGRISLVSPILIDMVEALEYKKKGKASTRLAMATFAGFTMFSSIFLSSKAIHFVVFGLLPPQVRDQFNWGFWFYSALVAGIVLFVFYFISSSFFFKNDEKPGLSKELLDVQKQILGPLTKHEWAALLGILLFAIGIATSSIHKIKLPWIGLTVLYIVLAFGYLSKKEFRINIDWTFLIYLGTLIGLVKSMSYIGLDQRLGQHVIWLGSYIQTNFYLFVLLLTVIILLMRVFIPNNATVAILASVFFPISALTGVNPWIIGFIILIMSDAWVMPYQSTYFLLFKELTDDKGLFDNKLFLKYNLLSISFRLIAVYASIPFWRFIGIL